MAAMLAEAKGYQPVVMLNERLEQRATGAWRPAILRGPNEGH